MSMNDLLIKERAENAQLRAHNAELEQQVAALENKDVTPIDYSESFQDLIDTGARIRKVVFGGANEQ